MRNRLLGIAAKDFDVAPSARPDTVHSLFARTIPVGMQFRVCLVLMDGQAVEGATFRADGYYLARRRSATCASPPRRRTLGGRIARSMVCSTTRSPTT